MAARRRLETALALETPVPPCRIGEARVLHVPDHGIAGRIPNGIARDEEVALDARAGEEAAQRRLPRRGATRLDAVLALERDVVTEHEARVRRPLRADDAAARERGVVLDDHALGRIQQREEPSVAAPRPPVDVLEQIVADDDPARLTARRAVIAP